MSLCDAYLWPTVADLPLCCRPSRRRAMLMQGCRWRQRRPCGGVDDGELWWQPVEHSVAGNTPSQIGLGSEPVGQNGGGEPRGQCPDPTPLFMALCNWGPPASAGLNASDQGVGQGPSWPWGQLVDTNLTFSPLISLFILCLLYTSPSPRD